MTPCASGAANTRSTSFEARGSKARGGTARCRQVLALITTPLHLAHKPLPPPRRPREIMIAPVLYQIGPTASRVRSPQELADPDFTDRYASLCRGPLRAKRANQLTTLAALQPQPVHGARQPEPQACKNYTASSAEYRLHVNRPYKGG